MAFFDKYFLLAELVIGKRDIDIISHLDKGF